MVSRTQNKNFDKKISLMFDKSSKSIMDSKILTKKISLAINEILKSLKNKDMPEYGSNTVKLLTKLELKKRMKDLSWIP